MPDREPLNPEALVNLTRLLQNPEFRVQFKADPIATIAAHSAEIGPLPESLIWTLADLSNTELRQLVEMVDRLSSNYDAGIGIQWCL